MKSLDEVTLMIKGILSDPKNLNNLVDLLDLYENDELIKDKLYCNFFKYLSCGLNLIFIKYLPIYRNCKKNSKSTFETNSNMERMRKWFQGLYKDYVSCLAGYIEISPDEHLIVSFMNLIKAKINLHGQIDDGIDHMIKFISSYSKNPTFNNLNVSFFESEYLIYDDIQWLVLKSISSLYQKECHSNTRNTYQRYIHNNILSLLKRCSSLVKCKNNKLAKPKKICDDSISTPSEYDIKKYYFLTNKALHLGNTQKIFSLAWIRFLQIQHDFHILISIYESLHIEVLPYILYPKMLADFLLESIDRGGALGLLCMTSVIILLTKHNMECSMLYKKIYKVLPYAVYFNDWNEKSEYSENLKHWWYGTSPNSQNYPSGRFCFWNTLHLLLSSTHLPAYMAASFCKRLARYALMCGSIGDTILCLITIGKILSLHEGIRFLMGRKHNTISLSNDPFHADTHDIEATCAMDSSLWELMSLRNHYCSEVVETVDSLIEDSDRAWKWRKIHFSVPKFLSNIDYDGIIQLLITDSTQQYSETTLIPINNELPSYFK